MVGSGENEFATVNNVFGESVAESALREGGPEDALDRGGDHEGERDAEEDTDDLIQADGDLGVESDGADDEQHADLVRQGDPGSDGKSAAPDEESGEDENEEDGVASEQWSDRDEDQARDREDCTGERDVVKSAVVAAAVGGGRVEDGENESAEDGQRPAGRL